MKKWAIGICCLLLFGVYGNAIAENPGTASEEEINPAEVHSLQQTMLSDQEIMNMIAGLQNDPDFKAALDDPELLKSVKENNIEALKNNPKFLKLLENQTVRQIQDKVGEGN